MKILFFFLLALTASTACFFLTLALVKQLTKSNIVATINERSAHRQSTPVGGGLAIACISLFAFATSSLFGTISTKFLLAYLPGAILITCVGLWDDIKGLTTKIRLLTYGLSAMWATWFIQPSTTFVFDEISLDLGAFTYLLMILFVIWLINLFNFMDGINGLVTCMTGLFGFFFAVFSIDLNIETMFFMAILAAACIGFLPWNFPNAQIFLGDTGSVFLGFTVSLVILNSSAETKFAIPCLIVLIPLTVDATMTLIMRLFKKENILQGHNKHLYQRINQLINSHTKTTLIYVAFTVFVLGPIAATARLSWYPAELVLCISYLISCMLWCVAYKYVSKKL